MREHHLDLNDPAFVFDPYPRLAELRETLPVFYDPVWKKVFTSGRVEGLRGTIQRFVDGLIDTVEARGEMDLLREFAEPLPVAVIAELLGVPASDRPRLRPWSAKIVKLYELSYTEGQGRGGQQGGLQF